MLAAHHLQNYWPHVKQDFMQYNIVFQILILSDDAPGRKELLTAPYPITLINFI